MKGQQLFDIIGLLSTVLSLPFASWIIYCFLKQLLGFRSKAWVFVLAVTLLSASDLFMLRNVSLPLKIIVNETFWLMIICLLCKGSFVAKLYASVVQASIMLLTSITFIGIDYKISSLLLNNLRTDYTGHMLLLLCIDLSRESVSLIILYIFLKNISNLINFREIKMNRYQGIYLLLPCLASYGMAVLFYIVQLVNIDNKKYLLLSIVPNVYYIVPLISISLLVSLPLTAYTFKKMLEGEDAQQKNLLMKQQFKQQLNHSKSVEGLYTRMRDIMHDMNNHLICLRRLSDENNIDEIKRYLKNFDDTISKLGFGIKTGNAISDAVINEKYNLAKEHGIEFIYDFMLPNNMLLEPMDLCVILGNALDNAIEACIRIDEPSIPRNINIKSYLKGMYLVIEISNSTTNKLQYENGRIISHKLDSVNHGIGISSIYAAAKKYNGVVDIIEEKNNFIMSIMLNLNREEMHSNADRFKFFRQ